MQKKDTYCYKLFRGYETVYIGITNDLNAREKEHINEGKKFDIMSIVGTPVTRDSALEWEEQELAKYRNSHQGRNPKYNNT
jgi:predicted GIY-YIG superfamily endonuclease